MYQSKATSHFAFEGDFLNAVGVGNFLRNGLTTLLINGPGWGSQSFSGVPVPFLAISVDTYGQVSGSTEALFPQGVPKAVHGRELVVLDFNSDGLSDIYVAGTGHDAPPFPGERQLLLMGTAAGTLVDVSTALPPYPLYVHSTAVADVDSNGFPDILVGQLGAQTLASSVDAAYKGPNVIPFLSGSAFGPFMLMGGQNTFPSYDNTRLPAQVAMPYDTSVNPWGSFNQPGRFTSVSLADINNDSHPDLILGSDENGLTSSIHLNDGKGKFLGSPIPLPTGHYGAKRTITVDIAPIDLDRDGDLDLVLSQTPGAPNFYSSGWLQFLQNDGQGRFEDVTAKWYPNQVEDSKWICFVKPVDLNADGLIDLLFQYDAYRASTKPVGLLNTGSEMTPWVNTSLGDFTVPTDFNHDGVIDLVSLQVESGQNSIQINTLLGNTQLPELPSAAQTDEVLRWAEFRFQEYFSEDLAGGSFWINGYRARHYSGDHGEVYLGTGPNGNVYGYGDEFGGLKDFGNWRNFMPEVVADLYL